MDNFSDLLRMDAEYKRQLYAKNPLVAKGFVRQDIKDILKCNFLHTGTNSYFFFV